MESNSNLLSLSSTLAAKKAQDSAAVAESTSTELKKLGDDLQKQSSAVLTTTALSITQSAAREMQHAEQQLSSQIEQMRKSLSEQLTKAQEQIAQQLTPIDPAEVQRHLDSVQTVIDGRMTQLRSQLSQQLRPMNPETLQLRLDTLQSQIEDQTKPLLAALGKVKTESEALALMTAKSWLKPVLISLAILASISLPVWGLTHYLADQIKSNLELIEQQEQTLSQIQSQTFGVTFQQDPTGQFLILPEGTRAEGGYQVGKRQAVKLLKNSN
jgi:hypothetical protein